MDLISAVSSSLGVDAQTAQGAVGSVLGFIKEQAPRETFAAVDDKVPEANSWMALAPASDGGGGLGLGGGGLGEVLGGVADALGLGRPTGGGGGAESGGGAQAGGGLLGGLAGLAGVISALSKLGLNAESLGKLVPLLLQFLQSRLGAGTSSRLISSVPALAQLAPSGSQPSASDLPPIDGTGGLQ